MVSPSSTLSLSHGVLIMAILSLNLLGGAWAGTWCIAIAGRPAETLQTALNWACSPSGGAADCTKIQPGGVCYLPNTVVDHASYAFNDYWQKHKMQGASCDFNEAARYTQIDPSHGSCIYLNIP